MAKFFGGDGQGKSGTGASYENTHFWKFLEKEQYESDMFLKLTFGATVFFNIFHFFIKKSALRRCIDNLFKNVKPIDEHD